MIIFSSREAFHPDIREYFQSKNDGAFYMELSFKLISELDFSLMEEEWQKLLMQSDAHPIFSSWAWLHSWWETWGNDLKLQLCLLAIYKGDELVGLGPFYYYEKIYRLIGKVKQIQLLGNAWKISSTVRSEYSGLIVNKSVSGVHESILKKLLDMEWHELVLCDVTESTADEIKETLSKFSDINLRRVKRNFDYGVTIDTTDKFDGWSKKLSRNMRRKVILDRSRVAKLGEIRKYHFDKSEMDRFFEILNNFHVLRWQKPCFTPMALKFHHRFIGRCRKCAIEATSIDLNGETISVLYDVRIGGVVCNIQSGYNENIRRNVSLGLIHLGYAIESAFNQEDIKAYDLLVGSGKNTFYKTRFQGRSYKLHTEQLVRGKRLKLLYYLSTLFSARLVRIINRWVGL